MKSKAPRPNEQVSEIRDEEDAIVAILPTVVHALKGEVHEQQVGHAVDDFGGVGCRVVVLYTTLSLAHPEHIIGTSFFNLPPHTSPRWT